MSLNPKFSKYFSLEEANKALILVKPIVKDILNSLNKISYYSDFQNQNLSNDQLADIQNLQLRLAHYLQELNSIGVILTDLQQGIVDFPMLKNNQLAFYCWKYGEEQIHFYHEANCDHTHRIYLHNLANPAN